MPGFTGIGYSGYQPAMAYQFREAISQNILHFQMCYMFDNVVCSHAGMSYIWLKEVFGLENDESEHNWSVDRMEYVYRFCKMNRPDIYQYHLIQNPFHDPEQCRACSVLFRHAGLYRLFSSIDHR